jgi:hypothetical protein
MPNNNNESDNSNMAVSIGLGSIVGSMATSPDKSLTMSSKRRVNFESSKFKWWFSPNNQRYVQWGIFLLIFNFVWIHIIMPVRLSTSECSVNI